MGFIKSFIFCAVLGLVAAQRNNLLTDPCQSKTRTAPHETQCDAYYECFDGQPYLQHCPNGLVYHGKRSSGLFGVCDYDFNVDCSPTPERSYAQVSPGQDDPCDHPHGVVGDVQYCDRYWECVSGQAQLYDCPNGLVFVGRNRGIADGCDYPWRGAYCLAKGRAGEKARANTPISTEHCDWLYGIFGHETSCTRYWTCWNGTATEQFCIGGLLYNEETHACDWPQNVQGCQKHPLCKDDPNANVPLGQSCERYWSCQGGYPRLQRCPATLVFDKISRRCVNPPTEDCEVPPPPPPTEQPETQFRAGGGPPRRGSPTRTRQQVQEPSQQQFVEEVVEEPIAEDPRQRPNLALSRPRRPQPFNLPNIPQGAIPINFNNNNNEGPPPQFRPAPIEGAIPLN
ncbi:hypothetical protein Anas_13948 [Armadillidium nasatum]|uniref:Chitin-binding type-2 domain-containing protein n=2 Tax=Armadillidium nasatum TaxID=96803 RepID=A0A5N5T7N7_9CRUS|nr:hypothetical protein Anas_13948 [Armadillidium nasatum]